jgi:hypothetical protein
MMMMRSGDDKFDSMTKSKCDLRLGSKLPKKLLIKKNETIDFDFINNRYFPAFDSLYK